MKITIYELLGMIKDGKAPKKIKYDGIIWEYDGNYYVNKNNTILEEYYNLSPCLNDEVEIIEETIEDRYREMEKVRNYKPNPSYLSPKEEKKIPEKLEKFDIQGLEVSGYSMTQAEYLLEDGIKENREIINWILDYIKSKGE